MGEGANRVLAGPLFRSSSDCLDGVIYRLGGLEGADAVEACLMLRQERQTHCDGVAAAFVLAVDNTNFIPSIQATVNTRFFTSSHASTSINLFARRQPGLINLCTVCSWSERLSTKTER